MKVKELKPILEVLDENIEVEFSIISNQEPLKNELRVRDNYRTCGAFTFGHVTNIEDPDGLTVTCWPIYDSEGLVGFLRQTDIRSICDKNQARTKGSEYWKRVSGRNEQLLQAIADFVCVEYDSYRDEFQTLFTLELDRYFAMDDYPEFDDEEEESDYWNSYHDKGIVPLVYFVK